MKNPRNQTLKELLATQAAVTRAIESARKDLVVKFINGVKRTAEQQGLRPGEDFNILGPITKVHLHPGLSLGELRDGAKGKLKFPSVRAKGKRSGFKVPVKYRNPKDKSQTWTGRGRMKTWLALALKDGKKLSDFAV